MLTTTPPSTNNFTVGLQNKNSAAERIASTQEAQQRIESNKASLNSRNGDAGAEFGLTHRDTSADRLGAIKNLQQSIVDNHGYDATQYTKNALTHNTKIINTPAMQRGSLLDVRI